MAATALPPPDRTSHPFFMHDMIYEIPKTIRETLRRNETRFAEVASRATARSSVTFTGCGTAFYAAMLADAGARIGADSAARIRAVQAFELSEYSRAPGPSSTLVGISHSGITKTTVDALRSARQSGALTVGLTHFDGRPIADAVDETLLVGNGPDKSRCHTKCYVAGAVAGTELAWHLLQSQDARNPRQAAAEEGLRELPSLIEAALPRQDRDAERLAGTYRKSRDFFIVGAGPNEGTALEVALKLKESSFVHAEGMELEQLLHGSWQAWDRGAVLVVIAPRGASRDRALDALRAAQHLGVQTVAVATEGDEAMDAAADFMFPLPDVDEWLAAYLAIVPLYLFAYHSAVKRGNNPDYLRYLEPAWWEARQVIFPPGTH